MATQHREVSLCSSGYIDEFLHIGTYDHRSVRTGHPVRNHEVSIVFIDPGMRSVRYACEPEVGTQRH